METLDLNGNPVSTVGEYHYDGDGKRVKTHVPSTGEVTVFVYDAGGKQVIDNKLDGALIGIGVVRHEDDHRRNPGAAHSENYRKERDFLLSVENKFRVRTNFEQRINFVWSQIGK